MSQLHEFIRRNVGQVITPELAVGLSWAVDSELSRMYGEAKKVAEQESREAYLRRERAKGLQNDDYPQTEHWGDYVFAREPMQNLRDLRELHEAHFDTTERPRAPDSDLTVDYDYYYTMADAGRMVLFVIRLGKVPVGNFIERVGKSQISGELVADEEVLFVAKDHRKGLLAATFVRWCMDQLKRWGVARITVATKETNDVSVFYRRMGFLPMAHVYGKEL
jgi:GNAT superfamily N-acetyltransferase